MFSRRLLQPVHLVGLDYNFCCCLGDVDPILGASGFRSSCRVDGVSEQLMGADRDLICPSMSKERAFTFMKESGAASEFQNLS
jgi:hypothetical protein